MGLVARCAPRRIAAVRAAALLALLATLLPTHVPRGASAAALGETSQRTITYEIRVRGEVRADVAAFARLAARTLNDRRGWSLGGSLRFRQVATGGAFTLWLASPSAMPTFSPVCTPQYSCRSGRHVVINDERWRLGTATWPTVREYRHYVVNHEVGHWLGLGHTGCPGAGAAGPVMMQQSKALNGCRATTWPNEAERRAAAAGARVHVRAKAPVLHAVTRAGTAGTEVHSLRGASGWTTWLAHAATALPVTLGTPVAFGTGDHDRDGVDDLYVVEHPAGGSAAVRVLAGASGYRTTLLHAVSPLRVVDPTAWSFLVADQDGDGHLDVLAVDRQGASGRTEVAVLDGASGFARVRLRTPTALHRTTAGWSFAVGDHDRDGAPDLYAVAHQGASGRTEAHVLSGASGFGRWLTNRATALAASAPQDVSFDVGDVDGDSYDDLVAVLRRGPSGRTELHALNRSWTGWLVRAVTPMGPTPPAVWSFAL